MPEDEGGKFKFKPRISEVYRATVTAGQQMRAALDGRQLEYPGIDFDRLAEAIEEYIGETEHQGPEGFRKGIRTSDIVDVLTDFFLYTCTSAELIN